MKKTNIAILSVLTVFSLTNWACEGPAGADGAAGVYISLSPALASVAKGSSLSVTATTKMVQTQVIHGQAVMEMSYPFLMALFQAYLKEQRLLLLSAMKQALALASSLALRVNHGRPMTLHWIFNPCLRLIISGFPVLMHVPGVIMQTMKKS